MKNLKKIIAALTSVTIAASLSTAVFVSSGTAAEVSEIYNKTYIENFDEAEKVFAEDGIFVYGQNATETNVTMADHNQGGKYMQIASGGADVQVLTKKGIFKHDVTVVDMSIRAVYGTQPFPLIRLVNNNVKMDTGNGLFRFVNSNKAIRSYNQATGTYDAVNLSNEWANIRIILDSTNKTITTVFNGSQAKTVSTMSSEWDNNNVQLCFQAAASSTIMLDNLIVSDGTYMEDVYMECDFDHSSTVNAAVGNNFFYNINKTQNPTLVYDSETNNSYLDITNSAGNLIYTAWTINTLNKAVVEFRMKATDATGISVQLKRNTNKAITPLFAANEIKTDGNFHTYRAVVTPMSAGYKAVKLIDEVYKGYNSREDGAFCGNDARLEINAGAGSADVAIDNVKVYYPQSPKIICDLRDKQDVALDSVIELVSNTRMNYTTATKATITANGEAVEYTTQPNNNKNSFIYNITGGLQPNTTYVINTGETGVRDYFDQYYNDTITFTTTDVVPTEQPSEEPEATEAPEPTATPEPTEAPSKTTATVDVQGGLSDGMIYCAFTVESDVTEGVVASGYVAQYNYDGTLASVEIVDLSLESAGKKEAESSLISIDDTIKEVKVFMWDDELNPIGEMVGLGR